MSYFRFVRYSAAELADCGRAFVADIAAYHGLFSQMTDSYQWTDYVIRWFCCAAAEGICTFAHYPQANSAWQSRFGQREIAHRSHGLWDSSEFLLDLTHVELAPLQSAGLGPSGPAARPVRLGLESEWGSECSRSANLQRILADASKLSAVRSNLKVMLYASVSSAEREMIIRCLCENRQMTGDTTPWLWIDIPWKCDKTAVRWDPFFGILPR